MNWNWMLDIWFVTQVILLISQSRSKKGLTAKTRLMLQSLQQRYTKKPQAENDIQGWGEGGEEERSKGRKRREIKAGEEEKEETEEKENIEKKIGEDQKS